MDDRGAHFRALGVQIITLFAALSVPAITQGQGRALASAAAQTQHVAATPLAAATLPTVAYTTANLGSSTQTSSLFVSSGSTVTARTDTTLFASTTDVSDGSPSPAASALANSNSFVFAAPSSTFAVIGAPNESTAVAIDFLPPLSDMLRIGLIADPATHVAPGLPGDGALNVNGASHYEAGVAPSLILGRHSRYPVTLTFSGHMSVNEDPYWFGHDYGWVSAGVAVRVPLSFIPKQFGRWSAGTTADLCYYGTSTDEFMRSIGLQMPKIGAAFKIDL